MTTSKEALKIWRLLLPLENELLNQLQDNLTNDEQIRRKQFHFKADQDRFIASRGGLRAILSQYLNMPPLDVPLEHTQFGKPYLKGSHLNFNVSHSANCILLAFTETGNIGIDVEFCKDMPDFLSIAKHSFCKNEYDKLVSLSVEERRLAFYRCWTRKEAFIKAIGKGLYFPLDHIEVSLLPSEEPKIIRILDPSLEKKKWQLYEINPEPNYIASLVIENGHFNLLSMGFISFSTISSEMIPTCL